MILVMKTAFILTCLVQVLVFAFCTFEPIGLYRGSITTATLNPSMYDRTGFIHNSSCSSPDVLVVGFPRQVFWWWQLFAFLGRITSRICPNRCLRGMVYEVWPALFETLFPSNGLFAPFPGREVVVHKAYL